MYPQNYIKMYRLSFYKIIYNLQFKYNSLSINVRFLTVYHNIKRQILKVWTIRLQQINDY